MWRNDVKDFMNALLPNDYTRKTQICFQVKDSDEVVEIEMDRPDLIFGITYVILPQRLLHLKDKKVLHPFTCEEIPIFILDVEKGRVGIPAHVDQDYVFAKEHGISIKQVVLPINASLDENKPRDDKEWVYRENVVLLVKHWKKNQFLYIDYNKQNWKCFISGGIESNESPKEAAIRELKEESGFYNVKTICEMPYQMANVFYAAHKGVNRYSIVTAFYVELFDGEKTDLAKEESEEHVVKWGSPQELYGILQNGFTDQIWLLKQQLGEIQAYTGNGKMYHSAFLDGIENPKEAVEKVIEHIKKL